MNWRSSEGQAHVRKVSKTIKTNLDGQSCSPIKGCPAIKCMRTMILSHLFYCVTVQGQATQSAVNPIMSLYK